MVPSHCLPQITEIVMKKFSKALLRQSRQPQKAFKVNSSPAEKRKITPISQVSYYLPGLYCWYQWNRGLLKPCNYLTSTELFNLLKECVTAPEKRIRKVHISLEDTIDFKEKIVCIIIVYVLRTWIPLCQFAKISQKSGYTPTLYIMIFAMLNIRLLYPSILVIGMWKA